MSGALPQARRFRLGRRLVSEVEAERRALAELDREVDAICGGRRWGDSALAAWGRFVPPAFRRVRR